MCLEIDSCCGIGAPWSVNIILSSGVVAISTKGSVVLSALDSVVVHSMVMPKWSLPLPY